MSASSIEDAAFESIQRPRFWTNLESRTKISLFFYGVDYPRVDNDFFCLIHLSTWSEIVIIKVLIPPILKKQWLLTSLAGILSTASIAPVGAPSSTAAQVLLLCIYNG